MTDISPQGCVCVCGGGGGGVGLQMTRLLVHKCLSLLFGKLKTCTFLSFIIL